MGYLRPRSRLYWPPYLQRFAASSVISGIQLANTAYTPTIIRCRQNRALTWVSFLLYFCFSFCLFYFYHFSLTLLFSLYTFLMAMVVFIVWLCLCVTVCMYACAYACVCLCVSSDKLSFRITVDDTFLQNYRFLNRLFCYRLKTIHARNASLSARPFVTRTDARHAPFAGQEQEKLARLEFVSDDRRHGNALWSCLRCSSNGVVRETSIDRQSKIVIRRTRHSVALYSLSTFRRCN